MRKLIFIGVMALVALLIVGGAPGKGGPPNESEERQGRVPVQDFEEVVVVDYVPETTHAGPGPHPASETNTFSLTMGGIKWFTSSTVNYRIDNSNAPAGLTGIDAAINAATATWDIVVSPVSFSQAGTGSFNRCLDDGDGIPETGEDNNISWSSLGASPGSPIAAAATCRNFVTKEIVGFRMILNSDLTWSDASSGTGVSGKFDIQNIVTHEFGHNVGADHVHAPKDGWATMYYISGTKETIKRTLANGECRYAEAQYGLSDTPLTTCLGQTDSGLTSAD